MLFVHGLSQSAMCWRKQFESTLVEDHRLVAMDCRGHGDSEKPRDAYDDSTLWADDVRAVIETLGLTDAVLVGWSYGGLVVLDYVEAYGTDRLAGLELVSAIAAIGTEVATDLLGSAYLDLLPGFVSTDAEESVETMRAFLDLCVYDDLSPADRYYMLGYNVVVPPYVRKGLRDRTVTREAELEGLDVPVLVTHGAEDVAVDPEAAERHTGLVDDADLSVYPETGHIPFWERPDRFERELRAFVREC